MSILRAAKCTICGTEELEPQYGLGWDGWMMVDGISIDDDQKVMLCPEHKTIVANYIDRVKEQHNGVD